MLTYCNYFYEIILIDDTSNIINMNSLWHFYYESLIFVNFY